MLWLTAGILTWPNMETFLFFPHLFNTDCRKIAATIFNGVQRYSTVFDGTRRRYSTVFNGIQQYSTVLDDGIARYSTVLDGIRRHWDDSLMSKHVIYDIGTKILYEPSFDHNSTQKAPNSINPEDFESSRPLL